MKGDARAIRVPYRTADRVLPQAFSYITEVRRVLVDTGVRIIGEAAWRNCQRLQIVHLASTVSACKHEFSADAMHSARCLPQAASSLGSKSLKGAAP